MGCLNVIISRVGKLTASFTRNGGLTASAKRIGGVATSAKRVGGLSVGSERVGGLSVQVSLVCPVNLGSDIYLLAAGDGSLLMTLDGGFLSFKRRT